MDGKNRCYKGEIYYADLGKTIGSEQAGIRPVIIVQNDIGNEKSTTTIVVPLTKNIRKKINQPTHFLLKPTGKIRYNSIVLAEQIRVIDKERIGSRVGRLNKKIIKCIDNIILETLGIVKK